MNVPVFIVELAGLCIIYFLLWITKPGCSYNKDPITSFCRNTQYLFG